MCQLHSRLVGFILYHFCMFTVVFISRGVLGIINPVLPVYSERLIIQGCWFFVSLSSWKGGPWPRRNPELSAVALWNSENELSVNSSRTEYLTLSLFKTHRAILRDSDLNCFLLHILTCWIIKDFVLNFKSWSETVNADLVQPVPQQKL